MTRPDPRTFGRRAVPLTPQQLHARIAAVALYVVFIGSLYGGCTAERPGLAVLFVVLAFSAMLAGMAAAGEA